MRFKKSILITGIIFITFMFQTIFGFTEDKRANRYGCTAIIVVKNASVDGA